MIIYYTGLSYSLGYPFKIDGTLAFCLISYLLLVNFRRIFLLWFGINTLMATFYLPQAIIYGKPYFGLVVSVIETNRYEVIEFLQNIPIQFYLLSVAFFFASFFIQKRLLALSSQIKSINYKKGIVMIFIAIVVIGYKPIKLHFKDSTAFRLHLTNCSPISFVSNVLYQMKLYHAMYVNNQPSDWDIQSFNPHYQNYILVIGESMRADYLSAYGYPINTTPFLANTNGLFIENFIAPASHTSTSLSRMLYRNKGEKMNYQNNLMVLAKQAGLHTYWISNQGQGGEHDTVASRVASDADKAFFTHTGEFDFTNVNDLKLVDVFEQFLKENKETPALYVLHLMGSHSKFCERIVAEPRYHFINQDMSCYLESLTQTDTFLQKIIEKVSHYGSYSLIYFSDHGLSHRNKENRNANLYHNNQYKQNYRVPFVKIASDDEKREVLKVNRSGFHFLSGYAQWLGIKERHLDKYQDFFSSQSDNAIRVFNGDEIVHFDELEDDPAIEH